LGHSEESVIEERLEDLLAVKKELNDIQFDEIWTSDLRRCQETLAFLLPDPGGALFSLKYINDP